MDSSGMVLSLLRGMDDDTMMLGGEVGVGFNATRTRSAPVLPVACVVSPTLDRYCGIASFVEFAFLHAHYFLNFQRVFGGSGGDGFF